MRPIFCASVLIVGLAGNCLAAQPGQSNMELQAAAPEKDKRECSEIDDAEEQTTCLVERNTKGGGKNGNGRPPPAAAPTGSDF